MKAAYLRATQDDIVTRLREYWFIHHAHPIAIEAYNEITRLRTENRELRSEIQRLSHQ